MKQKIIDKEWRDYRHHCVPAQAGRDQVEQTRMAFFAGASVILAALDVAATDGMSEAFGVKLLEALHQEMDEFRASLRVETN